MIQITPHMRILVAVEPVDFRKGIDGLAALCRQAFLERVRGHVSLEDYRKIQGMTYALPQILTLII
jgi:hypothetical protein